VASACHSATYLFQILDKRFKDAQMVIQLNLSWTVEDEVIIVPVVLHGWVARGSMWALKAKIREWTEAQK
jgi:hypothetical protein